MEMTKRVKCESCGGKGMIIPKKHGGMVVPRKCEHCNGTGTIEAQITNADRIRAMSDEELAEFLADKYVMESCLRLKDEGYEPTETQKKAIKHTLYCTWIQWLKQPAQEG